MNSSSPYFWTAIEIGSQRVGGQRIAKREIDSRQQIDVTHSGKKSYFDLDNKPMPVMILKRARRLPRF